MLCVASKKWAWWTACLLVLMLVAVPGFTGGAAEEEVEEVEVELPDYDPMEDRPRHLPEVTVEAFNEAPMLAERVDAGELPPVDERMPENPAVVGVRQEIGHYGGILRSTWVTWTLDMFLTNQVNYTDLVRMVRGNTGDFEADLAERWEVSDDNREYTFYLREGLRWSDGEPFTTEDIEFWYNDVLGNSELRPVTPAFFQIGGETPELTVIDDHAFRLTFDEPYGMFLLNLTQANTTGFEWTEFPKHYMTQFHPDYADAGELDAILDDRGFDSWVDLFEEEQKAYITGEKPVMWAFKPDGPVGEDGRSRWTRNPYYYKVDEEGNQLPYLDGADFEMEGDREVVLLNTIAGEYDFNNGIMMRTAQYPSLADAQERGEPIVLSDSTNAKQGQVSLFFNQNVDDDALREIFQDVRFLRAVSLSLDREEIVDAEFLGAAEGNQASFAPDDPVYLPEWSRAYADFDPDEANRLLDEMGLDERDEQGFRLRPDGERLTIDMSYVAGSHVPARELVAAHLGEYAGIEVRMQPAHESLAIERAASTSTHMHSYSDEPGFYAPEQLLPGDNYGNYAPLWRRYMLTDGADGEEPPEDFQRMWNLVQRALVADTVEDRVEYLQEAGRIRMDNLWVIGVAGMDLRPLTYHHRMRNVTIVPPYPWGIGQAPGSAALYVEQWFIDPDWPEI